MDAAGFHGFRHYICNILAETLSLVSSGVACPITVFTLLFWGRPGGGVCVMLSRRKKVIHAIYVAYVPFILVSHGGEGVFILLHRKSCIL